MSTPNGYTSGKKTQYPWPWPLEITCPGESLRATLATDARDWSVDRRDAWIWGIVNGWDREPGDPEEEDAMGEVAARHGWTPETVERLRLLHRAFDEAFSQPWKEKKETQ